MITLEGTGVNEFKVKCLKKEKKVKKTLIAQCVRTHLGKMFPSHIECINSSTTEAKITSSERKDFFVKSMQSFLKEQFVRKVVFLISFLTCQIKTLLVCQLIPAIIQHLFLTSWETKSVIILGMRHKNQIF